MLKKCGMEFVTRALAINVGNNFRFSTPSVFELRDRNKETDEQTDGQARRVMCPIGVDGRVVGPNSVFTAILWRYKDVCITDRPCSLQI